MSQGDFYTNAVQDILEKKVKLINLKLLDRFFHYQESIPKL